MAGMPTYGFFGDLIKGAGNLVTSIIPGPVDDIIFEGAKGILGSSNKPGARSSCPPGFRVNPRTGVCEQEGFRGSVERFLPGGRTGTLPQNGQVSQAGYGQAVMGSFGVPAQLPVQDTSPTLRCPPGSVLGKDNLCYEKSSIPRQFRKWKPGRRPPISAKDWKALQTANRVEKKAKKIAQTAGFSCRKR